MMTNQAKPSRASSFVALLILGVSVPTALSYVTIPPPRPPFDLSTLTTKAPPVSQPHQPLTGEVIGDTYGTRYLLCQNSKQSTSGKSHIYEAYRQGSDGNPCGEPVIVKLSSNTKALQREFRNFERIDSNAEHFVRLHDFLPQADPRSNRFPEHGALVMEKGCEDLRSFLKHNGPLHGQELREAATKIARIVESVHSSRMVWTEIKAENFVVQENGKIIKGIDLESAIDHQTNPIDYSPETMPPEFALALMCGREPFEKIDYKYDVWSLGMVLFEISTGRPYFDGIECNVQIANQIRSMQAVDLSQHTIDASLKDLISRCLTVDPNQRPCISQVLQHSFLSQGDNSGYSFLSQGDNSGYSFLSQGDNSGYFWG